MEKPARTKAIKPTGSGRRPPASGGPYRHAPLDVLFILGIACALAFGLWVNARHARFLEMKQVVERQTFYEGTTVDGVDVSGMTLSVAMDYWRDRVESRYAARAVTFDNGASVTAAELGYASDYESVLSNAWSAGRSGSLEARYRTASSRLSNPVAYGITRSAYSDAAVQQYAQSVAAQVDQPARDAGIQMFDIDTYQFVFSEAQPGCKLDVEALTASIERALDAGGGSVTLQLDVVEPRVTREEVAAQYGMIASAVTNASSSSKNRLNNISQAMTYINGTRLRPGDTFSFNDVVGQRTSARGFLMATAYSAGEVTEELGGGICQVSTTLFNAAVKADMEIVERHNHSLTVAYVDKGKDATVNWGNQDFRFKNTSADDVYIGCYLTDDKRVRIGIFGKLLPDGETITLEAVTTQTIRYGTEYQPSSLLASGQTNVLQAGRNGYEAEAYKIRWDAGGNLISRELLCKSRYQMKNEIIQYGA